MKSALLIANTHSGRGLSDAALGGVVRGFSEGGYRVDAVTTTPETGAGELAARLAPGCDLVVVAGGDGTLSGAVSGLMRTSPRPPVGYIPTGTACDVASTLRLPRDPREAVKRILGGRPTRLDIGAIGDDYFVYIAAFGAFTAVSYRTSPAAKRALGHLAYIFGAAGALGEGVKPRRVTVEHDGGTTEGEFLFGGVTNATKVAGLLKLPRERVKLSDGRFEVLLVRRPMSLGALSAIIANMVRGRYGSDDVMLLQSERVRFRLDEPVPWTRDGEAGGSFGDVEIRNCPQAIEIVL